MVVISKMASQLTVILNQKAGGSDEDSASEIEQALADSGIAHRVLRTSKSEDAEKIATRAIEEGSRNLCACGGDGTVAQVVNAILKSKRHELILSIIPLGTGNLIAEALGIMGEVEDSIEAIRSGTVQTIDVGRIGDHYFILGLGIGVTERFVTRVEDKVKKKLGRLAYVISLLKHTKSPPFQVEIEVDGKAIPTQRAEAATLANFWGTANLKLIKGSTPDDGVMELVVNEQITQIGLLRLMWHGLWGRIHQDDSVDAFQGTTFLIKSKPILPVQLDGNETELKTPVRVEIMHRALKVSVPLSD